MKTIQDFKRVEKMVLKVESLTADIISIEKLAVDVSNNKATGFSFKLLYDNKEDEKKDGILDEDGSLKTSGSEASDSFRRLMYTGVLLTSSTLNYTDNKSEITQDLQGYEVLYMLGALLDIKNKQREALIEQINKSGIQL